MGQDLSMHAKILTPVTLTLTSESAFRFQNLLLGFENSSQLLYYLRYTFYIWHTHSLGQDLSMHIKIFILVTLTLTPEPAFRFRNLRLGFENSSQLLYYMRFTFYILHTHAMGQDLSMLDKILTPVTLTLTLESAFRFQNLRLGFEN